MACIKKPGRPVGDKREALEAWLQDHPQFTMGQLVRCLGWSMREANNTIHLAIDRGDLRVVDRVVVQCGKRPVAVYSVPGRRPVDLLASALSTWAQ